MVGGKRCLWELLFVQQDDEGCWREEAAAVLPVVTAAVVG